MKITAILLITAAALFITTCGDSGPTNSDTDTDTNNQPPSAFSVIRIDTTGLDPVVFWEAATDPDDDPIIYSVFLDGQQVQTDISGSTVAVFEDLEFDTEFTGKVVASDGNGGSSEAEFNFTSREMRIQWEVNLGGSGRDEAKFILETTQGGFIVAGSSQSTDGDVSENNGDYDYWIVRLDEQGNLLWETTMGGSNNEFAESIDQTTDGGFIVAGYSRSSDGDVSANNGEADYWIVKLDAQGSILWEINHGGSSTDVARSIQQTADEGFIVGGVSRSSDGDVTGNNGGEDYWIVRLDAQGSILWETNLGGSGLDAAYSIRETTNGDFIVAGYTGSSDGDISGNNGSSDYWVVRLDQQGNLLWEKSFGGSGIERAHSIRETSDGGFIVVGNSGSSDGDVGGNNGDNDFWAVRLDGQGTLLWETNLGGSDFDQANSVWQTTDGEFVVAGFTLSSDGDLSGNNGGDGDYWIVHLDGQGSLLWEVPFGGTSADRGTSIVQTADGDFIVGGSARSSDRDLSSNNGDYDYWIFKLQ